MNTISPKPEYNSTPAQVRFVLGAIQKLGLYGALPVVMNESGAAYSDDAYRPVDLDKQNEALAQSFSVLWNYRAVNAASLFRICKSGPPSKRVADLFEALGVYASDPQLRIPKIATAYQMYEQAILEEVFGG